MREKAIETLRNLFMTDLIQAIPFRIVAVLVFGSFARESEGNDSDIDLLVVADGIDPKRHRRGKEVAVIKRGLPGVLLDILLLTREEVESNFWNHNPLFLDIATEGIVILDENEFLTGLMAETRDYIKQRGIQRIEESWVFPVKQGQATFLSSVSNQDFSQAMLKDGERDLEIGIKLIQEGYFDKAVYHFQQSVEKVVKSILIAVGIFQKTHLVGGILRKALMKEEMPESWEEALTEVAEISEEIEPAFSLSRYPGIINGSLWLPSNEYEKEDAEETMKKAIRAFGIGKSFVDDWFSEKA
jgi:HEPN domain-containing protein/predicted nucleotidyltransferase